MLKKRRPETQVSTVPPDNRVLVVGTTPDYIDWIRRARPRQTVFLTDANVRRASEQALPEPDEEICCDLTDMKQVRQTLAVHLRRWDLAITGVACFDCESLAPAAFLARTLSLRFSSPEAIANSRNKLLSKSAWRQTGLNTPRIAPVRQAKDAVAFFRTIGNDCVLKPVSGSGSELVFCCHTETECHSAFTALHEGLKHRTENRLYGELTSDSMMIEEFVDAPEYSCDFLLENGRAELIRLAKKISAAGTAPFGTTMAYILIEALPGIDRGMLLRTLALGAAVLGIERSVCMADFMIRADKMVLLEITPRPGGDCLPHLIRHALGLDMLMLTLDMARNIPVRLNGLPSAGFMTGLRLHSKKAGIIKKIHWETVADDPRIKAIIPLRQPGDKVRLPPDDYDSFLLGNIIFVPANPSIVENECRDILKRIEVEMTSS